MKHVTIWTAMLILVMGVAGPAEAQRSGFIIGFGVGPGLVSYTGSSPGPFSSDRETEIGLATDFHVGGVIGDSFELYFMSKLIFFEDVPTGLVVTGVNGIGFTYPLSPEFYINGGVGVGGWDEIDFNLLPDFSTRPPPRLLRGSGTSSWRRLPVGRTLGARLRYHVLKTG